MWVHLKDGSRVAFKNDPKKGFVPAKRRWLGRGLSDSIQFDISNKEGGFYFFGLSPQGFKPEEIKQVT